MAELHPETINAKPFLKWAGGKRQLIPAIEASLPRDIAEVENLTYIEPFVGSGAVMFWFLKRFKNVEKAIINDVNGDLVKAYNIIKTEPHNLIEHLNHIQETYQSILTEADKKYFYLEKRDQFNARDVNNLDNTTLLIFLNRTCFNGLYRVNSKNKFNVPFGRYHNPKICDPETILADSEILQKVTVLNADYSKITEYVDKNSFVYFDPPYKPISKTSTFNSYSADVFDDYQQKRLQEFCKTLDKLNAKWLMSNSDMKNFDADDNFFDDLYSDYNIKRVKAKRSINSNSKKRGEINEILIANYPFEV